jgi:hypothetical protein
MLLEILDIARIRILHYNRLGGNRGWCYRCDSRGEAACALWPMRAVNRKVGSRAAHGAIASLLQRALGLRVRKAPRAQNRVAELTHSCLDTRDRRREPRPTFLVSSFSQTWTGPIGADGCG